MKSKQQRTSCLKKRCLHCGHAKSGGYCSGGVSRTSAAYCTSPGKHVGWITPPGYEVDDKRLVQKDKAIKLAWRERNCLILKMRQTLLAGHNFTRARLYNFLPGTTQQTAIVWVLAKLPSDF
jgi:hypothetical protein